MKKHIAWIAGVLLMACALSACAGGAVNDDAAGAEQSESAPASEAASAPAGETFETDDFSLAVPDGWEVMEVDGGVQLYQMSGEVFEVHFRGYNMNGEEAEQQVKSMAEQYDGTTPKEMELLDKRFWTTEFTASGVPQVTNLCIEDGVMISVKYGGPDYDTNPDFSMILDSIVFK